MRNGCGKLVWAAALFLASTVLAGAGGAPQVLRLGNGAEPAELDPHMIRGMPEFMIAWALFEGLVLVDPHSFEIQPGAAASWDVDADGITYTFYLREDGRWSNGDPVTAEDFAFSIRRVLSPATTSPYASLLFVLRNARAYYEGEVGDFSLVGVEAVSDRELRLVLEHPTPYVLSLLNLPAFHPVHQETLTDFMSSQDDLRATGWSRPPSHVSNGPFRLSAWRLNQRVELERNPHYHGAEEVRLDGITFFPIQNAYTEERAFRDGRIHVTQGIPVEKVERYIESGSPYLQVNPDFGVYYLGFNLDQPPLDDPRVRRALSLSVDREIITNNIRRRGESVARHFTPPGLPGYHPPAVIRFDPDRARELLAEAGYPDGRGFPDLRLLFNTSETHRPIAEVIQAAWRRELGISIVLENTEWRTYLERRSRRDFQIIRAGWLGDYLDPTTFLNLWRSDSSHNHYGWAEPRYDKLLDQAARETNLSERFRLLAEAEGLFLEADVVLPIFFYNRAFLKDPRVKNWPSGVLTFPAYQNIELGPGD